MISIEKQAIWYAHKVISSGTKTLHFYPLKKRSDAISNQFRLMVLNLLRYRRTNMTLYGKVSNELKKMQAWAESEGYIIHEVNLQDYPQ